MTFLLVKLCLTITVFVVLPVSSSEIKWHYKFAYTKNLNSQFSIDCVNNDLIWIGWSHYGTRYPTSQQASTNDDYKFLPNFPNENDCWMNFTEKIAEQCNGAEQCDLSSQPTYIHKCGKISDYLYVAYKCIKEQDTFDICKSTKKIYTQEQSFYLKSSDFPNEYSSSLDCTCKISSNLHQTLKLEVLWFSLQDNDYMNLFSKNYSGWINPTYEMPIINRVNKIRFLTDDALAYKGFWLKVSGRKACRDDWQLVGDMCLKVFTDTLDWRSANQRCQQMNGNLLKIDDVVSDLKLTQYMKLFYPEVSSYWIGLRKSLDQYNQERWTWSNNSTVYSDVSWWPWRRLASQSGSSFSNCVIKRRNEDGYFTTSCDNSNKNSFICQTETVSPVNSEKNQEIKIECGNTDEFSSESDYSQSSVYSKDSELAQPVGTASIGINSINNIILPTFKPQISVKQEQKPIIIRPIIVQTSSSSSSTTASTEAPTKSIKSLMSSVIIRPNKSLMNDISSRFNTAVLAGIISGIGLVVVIVNVAVLFICRRNLKKFLKNTATKDTNLNQTSSDRSPRDDMIQEYFDAFNTLHNNTKSTTVRTNSTSTNLALSPNGNRFPIHNFNPSDNLIAMNKHLQTLRTNSLSSSSSSNTGDDSLLHHESAQLFYNNNNTQFNREMTMRQSTASAFKPFTRDDPNGLIAKQQILDMQRQLMLQQGNQYDRMNHHHPAQLKGKGSSLLITNDSTGQYAHTYESLDTLELPNRRQFVHLGISSRNYRTGTDLNQSSNLLQSPLANLDSNNGNISTTSTSTSSSSGTSSTHHLLMRNNNQSENLKLLDNQKFDDSQTKSNQLVCLNDLNKLSQFVILNNSTVKGANVQLINCALAQAIGGINNGEQQLFLSNQAGTWSPDSAYYSSIPTLTNYATNSNSFCIQQPTVPSSHQPQQQQQFVPHQFLNLNNNLINNVNNNNNDNFKSHLV